MRGIHLVKLDNIFIASDHAGFELKQHLMANLPHLAWQDLGPHSKDPVDYPDFANTLCHRMQQSPNSMGVLICGSGQGMAIRANRFPHIRAALCFQPETARMARQHNDANVLCLGARLTNFDVATKILLAFLEQTFEGGRHADRVRKLSENC